MSPFDLVLSFVAGAAAGAVYLAALWLCIRAVVHGGLSPAWLLASAILRLGALLGALFWIMHGDATRLIAALAGFVMVRLAATWPRPSIDQAARRSRAATHREERDAADAG